MRAKELTALFEKRSFDCKPWIRGKIPRHFKRLNIDMKDALSLAKLGATEMATYYGVKLHFCQSVVAGAFLSGKYETICWVTSPQYGKSWLFGRIALILAYLGNPVYIAGATADKTGMMMAQVIKATQEVAPEVKKALTLKQDEIDRLTQSLSKKRIGFSNAGFVEPITLGDAYADVITSSGAVGRSGVYMVDEAALCSEKAMQELDRRRFTSIDGKVYPLGMVSNPHKPGYFYDKITEEDEDDKTLIVWQDILTSVEEERWTEETVYSSEWAKDKANMKRYLLCVLDTEGSGMFENPKINDSPIQDPYVQYYLGIDSAYKGRDNICIALTALYEDEKPIARVQEVLTVDKKIWIDGKTSEDIVQDIMRIIRRFDVVLTCVDNGQGIWLVEGLANEGANVKGVYFQESPTKERVKAKHYSAVNAQMKRDEMHLDLQNLIDNDAIEFTTQAWGAVKDVFPFVTCERRANNKISVMPKSQLKVLIGRSPDELDAIILSVQALLRSSGETITYIT